MGLKSVPNQRHIIVSKEECNKENKYTTNNIGAIDEAVNRLQSKAGFKLYMYFAKNQDKYNMYLYSSNYSEWAGVSMTAYRTAFDELLKEGYLIADSNVNYKFYDKSQIERDKIEVVINKL